MASYHAERLTPRTLFFFTLGLAAAALFTLGSQTVDPDLFWHLRVAELIEAAGPRPLVDAFSYNSIPEPWLPYSWLAELGMRRAVESLGASALFFIPLACHLATVIFVALAVTDRAGRSLKAATIVIAVAALVLPFIGLRPATLAFPPCAFVAWAVTREDKSRGRWLAVAATVPITALIANIHLFFLFPPILLLTWGVGALFEGRATDPAARREALSYAGIAAVSVGLALVANPFGPGLLGVVGHYVLDDVMVKQGAIVEMRPFYRMGPLVLVGTSLLVAWPTAGLLRSGGRRDRRDLALLSLAVVLLLGPGRYVPLAALLLAPLAARYGPWPQLSAARAARLSAVGAGLVLALAVGAVQRVLSDPPERGLSQYIESRTTYPVAAARFVRDSVPRRTGRLINEMGWGGYLIYALWPDYQVMLDGRTQVYPKSLWRAAYVEGTRESRLGLLREARADAAVLPRNSVWAVILEDELGWRQVYADSTAAVWKVPGGIEPP